MKYRLGIDLGGTNIVSGVVDENYNIIAKVRIKTKSPRPSEEIVADMIESAKQAVSKAGLNFADIDCIGVGCPGSIDPKEGVVIYSNNLDFNDVPVTRMIEEKLSKRVFIENDANAAAYGEFIAGAGKGSENFVMITLGTGVGGGIIIDGKLFEGNLGAGAEIGHSVIVHGGEKCACGRRGCFEQYASASAIIRETKNAMLAHKDSLLWRVGSTDNVTGKTAFDFKDTDPYAKDVVDRYIEMLACGLVNFANVFRPEAIILGGGVCAQGEALLAPLREKFNSELFGGDVGPGVKITVAERGNDAGCLGAAALLF